MTGAEVRSNIFFIILKASKKNLNILKFHFPSEGAGEPKSGPEIAPQKADIFRKSHLSDTRHSILADNSQKYELKDETKYS